MEGIEDARNDLGREEGIAAECKEVRMAMRSRSSKHLLPDIRQPFLDDGVWTLAR